MGRLGKRGSWHRIVPVWKWPDCHATTPAGLTAWLRVGLDTVQVSDFEKPQQRLPVLFPSFFPEADFKLRLWPLAHRDPNLTAHFTLGLPCTRDLPGGSGLWLTMLVVTRPALPSLLRYHWAAPLPVRTLSLPLPALLWHSTGLAYPLGAASPSCTQLLTVINGNTPYDFSEPWTKDQFTRDSLSYFWWFLKKFQRNLHI